MSDRYIELADTLSSIECLMRSQGLWSERVPSAEAMASTMPFAVDLMEFEQWLQFIFLPRMHQVLAEGLPLPQACAIAPAAEVAFVGRMTQGNGLLELLYEFDAVFARA